MLDQLFDIVKKMGQDTVVKNPDVPNEHNQEVMAEATNTIASGFQNILAGGGFQNILDLFKGGGTKNSGSGIGGLLKNPIVSMMIGYFISKLIGKYKLSPAAASNVANDLIPKSLNNLIQQTNDPNNEKATLDKLIGSLTGGTGVQKDQTNGDESPLQDILDNFTGGGEQVGTNAGFDLQDIIGNLTNKAQRNIQQKRQESAGGLMDLIKGFMSN